MNIRKIVVKRSFNASFYISDTEDTAEQSAAKTGDLFSRRPLSHFSQRLSTALVKYLSYPNKHTTVHF